jgi:thiol-disulfide isomerase/thioredoxin
MMPHVIPALALALSALLAHSIAAPGAGVTPGTQSPQAPAQCLGDVRAYVQKRQQELRPLTSETVAQLSAERTAMINACAAKFDVKTVALKDLAGLADLYSELGQIDLANAAVARALASSSLTAADRAALLVQSIRLMLREPKSDERNARIEDIVDQLDAMGPTALEHQLAAHTLMNGFYRGDDIDAGIAKHSTWLIDTGKSLSPEMRKRYGSQIVSAYVNMAEAWAGQGRNDDAIALLRRASTDWADLPDVGLRTAGVLDRYLLVGTPAAAITAPTWINMPEGTTSLDMKGHVTLLEFTAHWCGPCKESYPGINRLRQRFGSRGFRVVLVTQLYGYFQAERNLDAATEIARDRSYFGEHHLDVPIAIGPRLMAPTQNGVVVSAAARKPNRDPNDEAYKVGGIPQIHLIDRQGRIRLIMVGYDDANEPKLAAMIESMLAER